MSVLLACVAYVVATTIVAPLILTSWQWQVWHPRLALACWHAALTSCGAVLIYSLISGLMMAHQYGQQTGTTLALLVTFGLWGGLFLVGALAALFLGQSEPVVRKRETDRRAWLRAIMGSPQRVEVRGAGVTILYVDSPAAVACSFHAPAPTVVVSSAVRQALTDRELDAVIAHELAHLTQRHHFATLLASLNAACLPRFPPAQRLEDATRLLVELIADDSAARSCGSASVASALGTLGALSEDPGLKSRAARMRVVAVAGREARRARPSASGP